MVGQRRQRPKGHLPDGSPSRGTGCKCTLRQNSSRAGPTRRRSRPRPHSPRRYRLPLPSALSFQWLLDEEAHAALSRSQGLSEVMVLWFSHQQRYDANDGCDRVAIPQRRLRFHLESAPVRRAAWSTPLGGLIYGGYAMALLEELLLRLIQGPQHIHSSSQPTPFCPSTSVILTVKFSRCEKLLALDEYLPTTLN